MSMAKANSSGRLSSAMERTNHWVFSQEIPTDIEVVVGEAVFSLHKFMLVAKSNYIRKLVMETKEPDLSRIDLSDIPGGPQCFEKAAKFCYGVNFEITVHNVAALRCAAEYLQMTDKYCDNNLVGRTEDFLSQVALASLSGAIVVLNSCQNLLPLAEDLGITQRCVDVVSTKACKEANYSSRSPPNWWADELSILDIESFAKVVASMNKSRDARSISMITALTTYAQRNLLGDQGFKLGDSKQQRQILETVVALLPLDRSAFSINFLCSLLRSAIYLQASNACKTELQKRISTVFENVTIDDLLMLSFAVEDGESILDLEVVRKIISGFAEKDKSMAVFGGSNFKETCSPTMQRVAKTLDSYLGEIATYPQLSISKFNGIANLIPKGARKVDDDLYRAIDIYLKAHPNLDEIEREKVCSVMDALKLSYEARVHASQNKRLPVQIVLHALYYDQLKLRSGANDFGEADDTAKSRSQMGSNDVTLIRENESLRAELTKMKMYVSDLQKNNPGTSKQQGGPKKPKFFSSMSKTLGKLNPFRQGSKDTSNIDEGVDTAKPRRRRFSIS
uniref:Root phototropism protein 2 n=1 Tax=Kalanchoe fedtschenkoi TaxID=63787 RepID=A0A7N0UGW3_KALFE